MEAGMIPSCSKLKLDSLFLQWLSLCESQEMVLRLLDDIKAGRPVNPSALVNSINTHKRVVTVTAFNHGAAPPKSPRKVGPSPQSPSKLSLFIPPRQVLSVPASPPQLSLSSPHKHIFHPSPFRPLLQKAELPKFYFPEDTDDMRQRFTTRTLEFLFPFGESMTLLGLKTLLRDVYGLPASLAYPLMVKIAPTADVGNNHAVPTAALQAWLASVDFAGRSHVERAFEILRAPDKQSISSANLKPLLAGVLSSHPGLAFLRESPEFQERYAETVIYRICYTLNASGSGILSLRDLKRGDLLEALHNIESEEDVNSCTRYFSYEHFYVIYCKFWDLDQDHDFILSRDDLLRYGQHSLTFRIADRIFEGAARPLASGVPGKMGYEDFVWFILSEEDKTTNTSLEYWFRAIDINGDNVLTPDELQWFYEEQLGRMECLSQETVSFEDVMSQMQDMLNPEEPGVFYLRDLKKSRSLAGTLFNVLFNLNKFVAFETRDPFTVRQEREDAASGATEWERFARMEYLRLAQEDEDDVDGEARDMGWAGLDTI